jgi:hypothetical protein
MCMVGFKLIGRAGGCAVSSGVAVPYIGVMCSLSTNPSGSTIMGYNI